MFIKIYREVKKRLRIALNKNTYLSDSIVKELQTALSNCMTKLSLLSADQQFEDYLSLITLVYEQYTNPKNKKKNLSDIDLSNGTLLIHIALTTGYALLKRHILENSQSPFAVGKIVEKLLNEVTRQANFYFVFMEILFENEQFIVVQELACLFINNIEKFKENLNKILSDTRFSSHVESVEKVTTIYMLQATSVVKSASQAIAKAASLEPVHAAISLEKQFKPYCDRNAATYHTKNKISAECVTYHCEAYLFGGAIHDESPNDLDIVMVRNDAATNFVEAIRRAHPIMSEYEKYGRHVIQVNYEGVKVDLTFFDGNLEKHSKEIDYTVNALYQDLRSGQVLDPQQKGLSDLEQGILRTVSNAETTLETQPVRILRGIKILAKGKGRFTPHPSFLTALKNLFAKRNLFNAINSDRLYAEFLHLFMRGFGQESYLVLRELNLFNLLFPVCERLTKEEKLVEIELIEAVLRFIDKSVETSHRVVPPLLLHHVIYWFDLQKSIPVQTGEPWINLQYGEYPALNPYTRDCCLLFIQGYFSGNKNLCALWEMAFQRESLSNAAGDFYQVGFWHVSPSKTKKIEQDTVFYKSSLTK